VRTPDEKLVWYKEIAARTKERIAALGMFDNWHGILVRDDYAGWHQFDATLAGMQQYGSHLIRHLQGVFAATPRCSSGPARFRRRCATRRNWPRSRKHS
jgi:transposase